MKKHEGEIDTIGFQHNSSVMLITTMAKPKPLMNLTNLMTAVVKVTAMRRRLTLLAGLVELAILVTPLSWAQTQPAVESQCWFAQVQVGSDTANAREIMDLYRGTQNAASVRRQLTQALVTHSCLHILFESESYRQALDATIVRTTRARADGEPFFADIRSLYRESETQGNQIPQRDPSSERCHDMSSLNLNARYACYIGNAYLQVNGFYPRATNAEQIILAVADTAVTVFALNSAQIRLVLETSALARLFETTARGIQVPNAYANVGKYVLEASGVVPDLTRPSYWDSGHEPNASALRVIRASEFLQDRDQVYVQYGTPHIVQLSSFVPPTLYFGSGPRLAEGMDREMRRAGYRYTHGEWRVSSSHH